MKNDELLVAMLEAPASDGLLDVQLAEIERQGTFRRYAEAGAYARLASAGIHITGNDHLAFISALAAASVHPDLIFRRGEKERDERIAVLAKELSALLRCGPSERHRWGDDLPDPERPEPAATVDVVELSNVLADLAISANQRRDWYASASELPGNRASLERFQYWLLLLAFWQFMGRGTGTSTDRCGDPGGPLVTFFQVMSRGGMSAAETSGAAIRRWLRDHSQKAGKYHELFVDIGSEAIVER